MEDRIRQDLKQAQLNRDEVTVSTLRLLLSEVTNTQIQKGESFSEQDLLGVIRKEVKKRQESAQAFRSGNRHELADKEEAERAVLEKYLPVQMSDEELSNLVSEVITQSGAHGISDMGKVIGQVLARAEGRANGGQVSQLVKAKLSP